MAADETDAPVTRGPDAEERMHHEFQTDNFFDSLVGVWRRVMIEPRRFFEEMPVTGGLQNPFLFLVVCCAISSAGFLVFGPRWFALTFLVVAIIRSFIAAAVLLVVARQIFGGSGDYEGSYRVVAYASAPAALLWIPLVRRIVWPLAGLYALYLVIVGLERVHGFDSVKSVLTVLLSAVTLAVVFWALGISGWLPIRPH